MALSDGVLPVVRETRSMLLPHWGAPGATVGKSASPHDVVTELDIAVERFLAERLGRLFPDAGFYGEELGGEYTDRFWICDPIDGTAHFVRGLPFCTVMLALVERWTVTFSVIYDFVNDAAYHAERGKGAFRDGTPIRVSDRPLKDAYLCWETHADKPQNLERFVKLRGAAAPVKTMSAGYEFAMIAGGKLEGRVSFDPWGKDYDFAPGSLLVSEAGGVVANLGVRSYDFRNHDFIAANPAVFQELTEGNGALFPIRAV